MLTKIGTAEVAVMRLPEKSLMGLHTEYGSGTFSFGDVRFCQSVGGECFWLSVNDGSPFGALYRVSTEDLMNAILNIVAEHHQK